MITIVMTTYVPPDKPKRGDYSIEVLNSLIYNLVLPEPVHFHIADDSPEDNPYIQDLASLWDEYDPHIPFDHYFTVGRTGHRGIGASLNLAQDFIRQNIWLYITDDWQLQTRLDLAPAVKLIDYGYDLVRLGPIHPNLKCTTKFSEKLGWWLDIDPTYGFAFATRPFLASDKFYKKVGPFKENCNAYQCEQDYAERVAKTDGIAIAYLGSISLSGPWKHIGEVEVGKDDIFNTK